MIAPAKVHEAREDYSMMNGTPHPAAPDDDRSWGDDAPGYPAATQEQIEREKGAIPPARPLTPSDIVRTWASEGQIVRVPTGFSTLDEACRGGLPIPWRVTIVGAPSAGKTALATVLASRVEAAGLCVGIIGVDEEPDDQNARFVQMAGFTIAQCEQRDPAVLEEMAERLSALRVRFYDATHTIEAATEDLGAWAVAEGRKAAVIVDTIQTARCAASADAKGPRELVEGNVTALRVAVSKHKLLLIALSEANRGSYQREDAAETANDMAAGAESRSIEFMAQTLMMLRTPKGHADVAHVRVPKNRKGARSGFEFWLKLDRDRHALAECQNPDDAPGVSQEKAQKKRAANRGALERDAQVVLRAIAKEPGIGTRALRAAVALGGLKIGHPALDALVLLLEETRRIENRPTTRGTLELPHYYAVSGDPS
jgi:hypothetical protein